MDTAKAKTGKSVEQWMVVIRKSGMSKQMEITNWLKKTHELNHLQSSLLAGSFLNGGKPVYQAQDNLLDNQFEKAGDMRKLYEEVSAKIAGLFPDVKIIPKKTYISFTAAREFAAINIKPQELRIGLDLGDAPFTTRVQKAKLTGPMPRISHMVIVAASGDFDKELTSLLKTSYSRVHPK